MFKKITYALLGILLFAGVDVAAQKKDKEAKKTPSSGQEITIKIRGLKDTMILLANYYADKTFKTDSVRLNKDGVGVFKPAKRYDCGVYLIAVNGVKLFEFMIKEDKFTIQTDTLDYGRYLKAIGSVENEKFFLYQTTTGMAGEQASKIHTLIGKLDKAKFADSVKRLEDMMDSIEKAVYDFRVKFVAENKQYLIGKMLTALKDVDVPDAPAGLDSAAARNWQYNYYKAHYWDNFDFTDDCLLRTPQPIFYNKFIRYFEKVTIQFPDSIISSVDALVAKVRNTPELYHYVVWHALYTYERSPIMCMDAIFEHVARNYITYKDAFWLDSVNILKIRSRAESIAPTLCNKVATNIQLHDSALEAEIVRLYKQFESDKQKVSDTISTLLAINQYSSHIKDLYRVKAKYTLLVFWDPDCGHCQKEIPLIKKTYDSLKSYGFQVFAACTEQELDKWAAFIRDHKLTWINGIDIYNTSRFREYYDVSSTPVLYLLDEKKKIIAKRLSAEQLETLLIEDLDIMGKKKVNSNPTDTKKAE